jgi:gluconokinase
MSTAVSHRFYDSRFTGAAIVMGVASCGKTTIGQALAQALQVDFTEGDKLHSSANIAKMSSGTPLNDDDRSPWLDAVGSTLHGDEGQIASCSALRRTYRNKICKAAGRPVKFVHLHGTPALLQQRMSLRNGHFMPASLLESQLATLEMPDSDEAAITINIDQSTDAILRIAIDFLLKGQNMHNAMVVDRP